MHLALGRVEIHDRVYNPYCPQAPGIRILNLTPLHPRSPSMPWPHGCLPYEKNQEGFFLIILMKPGKWSNWIKWLPCCVLCGLSLLPRTHLKWGVFDSGICTSPCSPHAYSLVISLLANSNNGWLGH